MTARLLLDTHILIRWIAESHRLSREQLRVLRTAEQQGEALAISGITLVEVVQLESGGRMQLSASIQETFRVLEENSPFQILPITLAIARDVPHLAPVLRDPADCIIAATARVHGLRLLTSDQRLLDSNVVPTIG